MSDEDLRKTVSTALLVLRATAGLFLLQWGIEKFLKPANTIAIWDYFYGIDVSTTLSYVFGAFEIAIAICMLLGIFRTIAYGAAVLLHAGSVIGSWRQLFDPWGEPTNHLFSAGVPVLGALIALFLLRRWDRGAFG